MARKKKVVSEVAIRAMKEGEPHFRKPLLRAIAMCGGLRGLANLTVPRLSHTTIRNFERLTDRPPRPAHVISIEAATSGAVDRMEFYPELFQGPLGKQIGKVLREYAEHDPDLMHLIVDMERRGIAI